MHRQKHKKTITIPARNFNVGPMCARSSGGKKLLSELIMSEMQIQKQMQEKKKKPKQ